MATTKVAIAPMKVAQIPNAGADFQIVEREIPKPGAGHVRIKVEACGVCHSDMFTKEGRRAGLADDRADAAENRPCRALTGGKSLARNRDDGRGQLAGQAVLNGAARLALHRAIRLEAAFFSYSGSR